LHIEGWLEAMQTLCAGRAGRTPSGHALAGRLDWRGACVSGVIRSIRPPCGSRRCRRGISPMRIQQRRLGAGGVLWQESEGGRWASVSV